RQFAQQYEKMTPGERVAMAAQIGFFGTLATGSSIHSAKNIHAAIGSKSFEGTSLIEQDFSGASLNRAKFSNSLIDRGNFTGAQLNGAEFPGVYMRTNNFSRANLANADFSGVQEFIAGNKFVQANLDNANFSNTFHNFSNFSNASAKSADFSGADLWGFSIATNFSGADLENASFRNSQLGSASFVDANLKGADFRGAEVFLSTVDLTGANLEGIKAHPTVLRNLEQGRPPLEGTDVLRFSDVNLSEVLPNEGGLPKLSQGGYQVVVGWRNDASIDAQSQMDKATVFYRPTNDALDAKGDPVAAASEGVTRNHKTVARENIIDVVSDKSTRVGATLMPQADGSYALKTQSHSMNSKATGSLGDTPIETESRASTKPAQRPNDVYLKGAVVDTLIPRLEKSLGIRVTSVDGEPRSKATDLAASTSGTVPVTFDREELAGRNFSGADLNGSNFLNSVINSSNFTSAQLSEAQFTGSLLTANDFSNAELVDADFSGVKQFCAGNKFSHANLTNADFSGTFHGDTNFSDVKAKNSDFSNSHLAGRFGHVTFDGADLERASFRNSLLRSSSFVDANLSGADFRGAEEFLPTIQAEATSIEGIKAHPIVLKNLAQDRPPLEGA
ncbi:MAG: pentapeptide repeat-containing protein, partial [Casimicrobium sp.]